MSSRPSNNTSCQFSGTLVAKGARWSHPGSVSLVLGVVGIVAVACLAPEYDKLPASPNANGGTRGGGSSQGGSGSDNGTTSATGGNDDGCPGTQQLCDTFCVDLEVNSLHCGACDHACPPAARAARTEAAPASPA